jgi:hypothetical protein
MSHGTLAHELYEDCPKCKEVISSVKDTIETISGYFPDEKIRAKELLNEFLYQLKELKEKGKI